MTFWFQYAADASDASDDSVGNIENPRHDTFTQGSFDEQDDKGHSMEHQQIDTHETISVSIVVKILYEANIMFLMNC